MQITFSCQHGSQYELVCLMVHFISVKEIYSETTQFGLKINSRANFRVKVCVQNTSKVNR